MTQQVPSRWCRRRFLSTACGVLIGRSTAGAALSSKYEQSVLGKKPVGYWRLGDAAGGVAQDSTSGKANGTPQGAAKRADGAIKGDPDAAITINGKTAFVEVPNSLSFSQPSSGKGLTVEVWMRPEILEFEGETADPHVHWLGKGEPGSFEWGFRFYSRSSSRPNRISAYLWNPQGGLGSGAYFEDRLKPGEWMHVVACFDPGDHTDSKAGVSIFKNGVFRGGPSNQPGSLYKAYKVASQPGPAPVRIGTRDKKSYFTGTLDEVAIYPRVLRPAEILQNYRAGF